MNMPQEFCREQKMGITPYSHLLYQWSTLHISLRKHYRGERLYQLLELLGDIICVLSVSAEAYAKAIHSRAVDFEDAIRLFSAIEGNMDCIITRNVRDFIEGHVPIITPYDFLSTPITA